MFISSRLSRAILFTILFTTNAIVAQDSTGPDYSGLFEERGTSGGRSIAPVTGNAAGNLNGASGAGGTGGTNTGPGTFVSPSLPARQMVDARRVNASVTRSQYQDILSSGRYVTGRTMQPVAPGSPDVVEWITYRNVVRVAAVAGNGGDNDQLLLELGEEYQEMVVPTVLNNNHLARAIQQIGLSQQIDALEAAVQTADQNLYANSYAYYTTADPALQANYLNCYHAWEARKTLLNQQLRSLKSQLSIIQQ